MKTVGVTDYTNQIPYLPYRKKTNKQQQEYNKNTRKNKPTPHTPNTQNRLSTRIYDKLDDFDFEIVNFPSSDNFPSSTSYRVYISQLIRFARASCHVTVFNTRNKLLTQKLLKQGYR